MEEDFLNNALIERFEQMLEDKGKLYFDTEEFYEIIAYYLDVRDFPFAKKAIEYALEMYPTSTEMHIKKLEYLLAINRLKQASILIGELKEVGSNDVDYILCLAKFWSLKENPRQAISFYKKALIFGEDVEYIYNCIGNEYIILYEMDKALYYFKKAVDLDLDDEYAFYSCVHCYEELGLHEECVQFLLDYIELRPYSENAWFQLGDEYIILEKYEEAHRAYDYATLINPSGISSYTQKAMCLEKLGDLEGAIEIYEETLALDDTAAHTYLNIGNCYLKLGKPYKALQSFHQSIHEDPQLDQSWVATSDLYEKLGNYEEALYYLNRGIDLEGENADYWKRRAHLNIQLTKLEEASLDYYKLIELEPNNFYNWLGLSETLIAIGDYQKAIEVAYQGLKHFNRAELYYQLSTCFYLLGEDEMGKQTFNKASEINASLQHEMFKKYPILNSKMNIKTTKRTIKKRN